MSHPAWVQMSPGVKRRVREDGERLMVVEVAFEAGASVPAHAHIHEQVSCVVGGRMIFTVEGREVELAAGDTLRLPSGVSHGARAVVPSVVLDAFSPPREDFR